MKIQTKLVMLTATMALGAAPALALDPPSGTPAPTNAGITPTTLGSRGATHKPSTPGPNASPTAKARAYGKYCQGQSKTHAAGQHGTPFSKCVTDMAKLANGSTTNPRTACKDERKTHVVGQHGRPFSLCVSGGARLLRNQASGNGRSGPSPA